jgi:cytochrome bd ubiquinol oxidase subunit II
MSLDLPVIFAVLMGAAILAYVILDGYDLGVAMLMPAATAVEQERMVASIGPFWDANQTWLVLGVGLLLVAFPAAHGIVMTALYLPVIAMLIGLMLRGVSFEFRVKAEGWHREMWNWLFWFGSFLTSVAQGLMLASYISGFESGFGYFLFGLVVAGGVCGGYVLLGATWLIWRTDGELQRKAVAWTHWGLLWVALGVAFVSLATPILSETVYHKWFDFPRTLGLMLLPLASGAAWLWVWRAASSVRTGPTMPHWAPFAGAVALYLFAFAGLAYSLFPYVVMDRMTIWEAAAHPSSLKVVLVGALVVLPFIIGYTIYAYRVFRGKAPTKLYDH